MITLQMFTMVFYVLGFDLTPHREADEEHISVPCQGNVRIEARFRKPLPLPVTLSCMLSFQDTSRLTIPETVQ